MRRLATGAVALLVHVLAVLLLLAAFRPQTFGIGSSVREITITLPVTDRNRSRSKPSPGVPPPSFLIPEAEPRAITPPLLQELPPARAPSTTEEPQGDMRALGRYLYNCSGAYYERLSSREREHCLDNKWNGQKGPALTLGPAKPSPFDDVIAKRNEKAVPFEHPCPVEKPTSNLGMPCYDFSGAHAPLVQFQH